MNAAVVIPNALINILRVDVRGYSDVIVSLKWGEGVQRELELALEDRTILSVLEVLQRLGTHDWRGRVDSNSNNDSRGMGP